MTDTWPTREEWEAEQRFHAECRVQQDRATGWHPLADLDPGVAWQKELERRAFLEELDTLVEEYVRKEQEHLEKCDAFLGECLEEPPRDTEERARKEREHLGKCDAFLEECRRG